MKILFLGGTSFFGKDMVRLFHEAGYEVTVFTRGNVLPADLPSVRYLKGNRDNRADLETAAKAEPRWDVVIDNIAFDGRQVADALAAFESAKRYVLCSTVSVYRFAFDTAAQPLYENSVDFKSQPPLEDPNNVHWKYARGKLEAERAVMEQTKTPWTILRPPVIYGPFDISNRGFWYLERLRQGGPIILGDGGSQSFRLSYSVDIARSFLAACETSKTVGKSYNVAQGEVITLKQFVETSAEFLKAKVETVSAPLEILGDLAGPYANMINLVPDCTAAENDFGFTTTPFRRFAALTAHWFRDHWKGDPKSLLKTRAEELKFVDEWRKATKEFPKRVAS